LIPPAEEAGATVNVLAAGSGQSNRELFRILRHSRWTVSCVETVSESKALLARGWRGVLICEAKLPDGTWKDMLAHALGLPWPPPLIVVALHADDALWTEVLETGGYNLIGKPFSESEVFQIVSAAWLRQRERGRGGVLAAGR
jgi:FixJ family two-component response regulator